MCFFVNMNNFWVYYFQHFAADELGYNNEVTPILYDKKVKYIFRKEWDTT